METWSIRPATVDDLPALAEIESKVQVAPWTAAQFGTELEKPYARVLVMTDDETDSRIAGYIVFWSLMGEGQVLNLGVDLPYRGLGLAKQMLRHAFTALSRDGAKKVTLEVRKSNTPAVHLYHASKFNICQIRKQFYSNGEDAYQMEALLERDVYDF